eukprot:TRINITY_DN41821_c0_g1_i1.p1 TRINITY_DN41821_c0_g1~~TRINITY_DN41821_c0_g1_i1.p1  ORF type:complete len:769 (+),score=117.36 TRINITY_DN41821_c0_g1_i1:311-2617(+)
MIDTSGGGGRMAPELTNSGGKQRTISCSTEESGVESLSPTESSIPSSECSSPPTTAPHSDPESETSDYPRNTPSPGSSSKYKSKCGKKISKGSVSTKCSRNASTNSSDINSATQEFSFQESNGQKIGCQRRATVPPCSGAKLQNLKVSLHKLSLPLDALGSQLDINHCDRLKVNTEMCWKFSDTKREVKRSQRSEPCEKHSKKVKLESSNVHAEIKCTKSPAHPSHFGQNNPKKSSQLDDSKCNFKVLPKQANNQQLNSKVLHGSLLLKSESLEESKLHLHGSKSLPGQPKPMESDSKLKAKTEDMKLEIAKIDSILQGNLLLDKSSHKISDILLLDKLKSRYPVKQEFYSSLESKQENERYENPNLQILNSNAIPSDSSIEGPLNKYNELSCVHTNISCENDNSSHEEEIDVVTVEKCSISSQEKESSKFIVSSEESIASNASNEGCGLSNESSDLSNKGIKLSNRRRIKQNEESRVSEEGLDSIVESIVDVDKEFIDCKWKGCGEKLEVQHLLEHLTGLHVYNQTKSLETESESDKRVQCLWAGCKVFGTWSTSRTWLSKHVTSHVGSKPFQCIWDGCRQRFGSQVTLSRHVNSHFKHPCVPSNQSSAKKNVETTPIKFYIRKNRRKNKAAVTQVSNIGMDPFDIGIMAGIKDGLSKIKKKPKGQRKKLSEINFDSSGNCVIFHSQVNSRKLDENGNIHYLISWFPLGMLKDEWVCEEEYRTRKKVLISQLPQVTKDTIEEQIFGQRSRTKNLRKPIRNYGPSKLT